MSFPKVYKCFKLLPNGHARERQQTETCTNFSYKSMKHIIFSLLAQNHPEATLERLNRSY